MKCLSIPKKYYDQRQYSQSHPLAYQINPHIPGQPTQSSISSTDSSNDVSTA
ncbi:MAG: hypothetical protein V1872_05200 [bacterium]